MKNYFRSVFFFLVCIIAGGNFDVNAVASDTNPVCIFSGEIKTVTYMQASTYPDDGSPCNRGGRSVPNRYNVDIMPEFIESATLDDRKKCEELFPFNTIQTFTIGESDVKIGDNFSNGGRIRGVVQFSDDACNPENTLRAYALGEEDIPECEAKIEPCLPSESLILKESEFDGMFCRMPVCVPEEQFPDCAASISMCKEAEVMMYDVVSEEGNMCRMGSCIAAQDVPPCPDSKESCKQGEEMRFSVEEAEENMCRLASCQIKSELPLCPVKTEPCGIGELKRMEEVTLAGASCLLPLCENEDTYKMCPVAIHECAPNEERQFELARFLDSFCKIPLCAEKKSEYSDASAMEVFSDIQDSSHKEAIVFVKEQGFVSGYADFTYRPKNFINRAEFLKVLLSAKNFSEAIDSEFKALPINYYYAYFPDVPVSAWFAKYITYAKNHDIVQGYPDGLFYPERNIRLREALKIIMRTFSCPPDLEGTDDLQVYVDVAYQMEWLNNIDISSDHFLTRGEMAELIAVILRSETCLEKNHVEKFE